MDKRAEFDLQDTRLEVSSTARETAFPDIKYPTVALRGTFIILLFGALYFAREFLLPITLALLFSLTLSPIVRFLARRGVPPGFSSIIILLMTVSSLAIGGYMLSGPVSNLIEEAPEVGAQLKKKISEIRKPVDAVVKASEQVDKVTTPESDPMVQQVVVKQPGLLTNAMSGAGTLLTTIAVTLVLMFFLLASGDLFYEKAIRAVPSLSDKKRILRIIYDIENEVSSYLFTVFLINAGLGVVVGTGMYILGMPNFYVWGLAAALLNFIPYVGAVIGVSLVTAAAIVSFDSILHASAVMLFYFFASVVEGQFITPLLLGRRLELNAVAIFIAVALWTWLWGFVGALIAVPLLVIVKVFCDHFDNLRAFGEFLSARYPASVAENDAAAT